METEVKNVGSVQDGISTPKVDMQAEAAAQGTAAPKASNLFVKMNLEAQSASILSPQGEQYKKMLVEGLGARGVKHKLFPSSNLHAFYKDGKTMGVIFTENMNEVVTTGSQKYILKAHHEFSLQRQSECGLLIDVVVVDPTDYERAASMIQYLDNSLAYGLEASITIDAIRNCRYRISTNPIYVRERLANMSPHGVPARVDYGFVLEIQNNTHQDLAQNTRQLQEMEYIPIAAVGAYTDILRAPSSNMGDRFLPIIHISDMQADVRNIRLMPMLQNMATEIFFTNRHWMNPFTLFGNSKQNIGNLFFLDNGDPDSVNSIDQLKNCLNSYFETPMIVMDIQHGRATLPGMYLAANDAGLRCLNAEIWSFLGMPSKAETTPTMFNVATDMLTGLVNLEGKIVDTRCVDYFTACPALYKTNRDILGRFLVYAEAADDRMNLLKQCNYVPSALYTTSMAPLNIDAIAEIMSVMVASLNIQVDYSAVQNTYSAGMLIDAGKRLNMIAQQNGSMIMQRNTSRMGIGLMQQNAFGHQNGGSSIIR